MVSLTLYNLKEFFENLLEIKWSRISKHEFMKETLLTWFKHKRANRVPISGAILQQKASDFGRLIEKECT